MKIGEISKIKWDLSKVQALARNTGTDYDTVYGQLEVMVEFEIVDRVGKKTMGELVDRFASIVHSVMTAAHLHAEEMPMSLTEIEDVCLDIISSVPVKWPD